MKVIILLSIALGLSVAAQVPKGQSLPIGEGIADDPAVAKVIEPLAQELRASYGQVLVEAPKGLYRGRGGEESFLGYWVADLMRARAEQISGRPVPFAITNSGGLRANLRPGPVKVGDLYEVMPFENELVIAEYTGAEVIDIVTTGILRRQGEPCSGIKASLTGTVEAPVLSITWADGRPIQPGETVLIALTDYLLASGDGLSTLRKGRKPFTTGIPLRQLLLDEATRLGKLKAPLLPPAGGRFTFAPELLQALKDKNPALQQALRGAKP